MLKRTVVALCAVSGIIGIANTPAFGLDDCGGLGGTSVEYCQENTGDSVAVVAQKGLSRQSTSKSTPGAPTKRDGKSQRTAHPNPDVLPVVRGHNVPVDCDAPSIECRAAASPRPTAAPPAIPAVTLTDLATFRPTPPTLVSEPDRTAIAGLDLNLIVTTPPQTLHGELFDHAVSVRFTPDHYTWRYGDGTTSTTTSPGGSWNQRGQAQFTPTPTSHVYAERGAYTATVSVAYSPTVTFDTGLVQAVDGYVTSTSAPQRIRVLEAHTALVAHTCQEDPTGPGC